ncbi:hypothetical protein BJV74DRAFT_799921, partial [Russula compacta]
MGSAFNILDWAYKLKADSNCILHHFSADQQLTLYHTLPALKDLQTVWEAKLADPHFDGTGILGTRSGDVQESQITPVKSRFRDESTRLTGCWRYQVIILGFWCHSAASWQAREPWGHLDLEARPSYAIWAGACDTAWTMLSGMPTRQDDEAGTLDIAKVSVSAL